MIRLDHHEIQALLGVYAADAIEDAAERAAIERHLLDCEPCREEVDGHLDVLSRFSAETPRVDDESWARLAAAIARPALVAVPDAPTAVAPVSRDEPAGAQVVPLRRRGRLVAALAPVAAAAAAVLITLAVSGGDDGLGTPVRDAAVKPLLQTASVAGTVSLYRTDAPDGVVVIDLENVPAAPSGHHYEVWVLRPGDGEMEAIGAFTPTGEKVRLQLRLPGAGEYVAVDISVEENGGSPEHSGTSLARALLS